MPASDQSMIERVDELKKRIQVLDGDKKGYYERSQYAMKTNKDEIMSLRSRNKELRKDLAKKKAGDEKVIDESFKERDPNRHCAMRGLSGKVGGCFEAINRVDQQVCEKKKYLNKLLHDKKRYEDRLASHQTDYEKMVTEAQAVTETDAGESKDAQYVRGLENKLDKITQKCCEAKVIRQTYQAIVDQLNKEKRTWPKCLDDYEKEIKEAIEDLERIKCMCQDAHMARDAAKAEFSHMEKKVQTDRKEREVELAALKKEAEEKKEHAERVEKRLQRSSVQADEISEQKVPLSGEEQERKITTYEEAMNKIKDATGVSDIQVVVDRFFKQGETQKHLESLKIQNEKKLTMLLETREDQKKKFEDMKYSGEAKLSSGQRILEEFQSKLAEEEKKCEECTQQQERTSRILVNVKAGIDHLADKLQHLKAPKGQVPQAQLSPESDEYILDLLGICEQKLLKLMDSVGGKDMDEAMKMMEELEIRSGMEGKLPAHNTRIKLQSKQERPPTYEDEEDSGDNEDVPNRSDIKRQAQQIVDSKTKKHKARKAPKPARKGK